MFYLAYNIISIFLLIPVFLFNIFRSIRLGWPLAIAERFGFIPANKLSIIAGRPVIWLHAVSVGEVIAARPLLKALRHKYPDHAIVVSNTTETGKTTASGFKEIDLCIYFPFDFMPSVRILLNAVKPDIIIIMETEIWPNFCREAARNQIPLLLANGRISDRSFKRYLKFSWFFKPALRCFSSVCMQSQPGLERIIAIGAAPENTLVAGNLKNDIPSQPPTEQKRNELRSNYSIPENSCVITAGSTREGEEKHLISSYKTLLTEFQNLFLALVPRHPERAEEVAVLLKSTGINFQRRKNLDSNNRLKHGDVLLVDTVGEMMNMYALSDFSFVGGSLVPIGGHNLLEPASVGVPTVFGKHMSNFREIETLVLQYQAGIQLQSPEELTAAFRSLISNSDLRHLIGQNGLKLIRENGGATERHMTIIKRYL